MARYGITGTRAERSLAESGWWGEAGPVEGYGEVLGSLSRSPDPELALLGVDRLREASGAGWDELSVALRDDTGLRARLFSVLGSSTALSDFLIANPAQWHRLAGAGGPGTPGPGSANVRSSCAGALLASVGADASHARPVAAKRGEEAVRALRTAYRGLLLDIAAADLAHLVEPTLPVPSYEQVAYALTDLAEAALIAALAVATAEVCGPAEAASGTAEVCGPAEAASDTAEAGRPAGTDGAETDGAETDGAETDGAETDGAAPPARLAVIAMGKCGGRELNYVSDVDVVFAAEGDLDVATRLASSMMSVAGKACFEVDAALRPEGKSGVLVRTVDGHVSYYRRWARTWEFQALLKARPIAGDLELGQRYLDEITPMIWSSADRENFVADVQQMRRRVEKHVPAELAERELKLGRGGLRDVEFAVQLLQLVHGRSDPALRVRSTLDALAVLGSGGYVGRADAAGLSESYQFLRTVEHRLQLQKLRRTHLFPAEDDEPELRWLARATGVQPKRGRASGEVLQAEVRRHASRIRRLHEKLFYRPLLEAVSKVPAEGMRLTASQALERLSALGYAAPDGALQHIKALTSGMSRRAAIQRALLPVLLDLLAETPDPDRGLLAYRRVSEALAETPWYLRVLRDEGAVVEHLATLLGTSKLVPDLMVRAPEVLRLLGDPASLTGRDPAEVALSLRQTVRRHTDLGAAVAAARSLRRHELARVACADLLGLLEVPAVCEALSSVWVAVLESALEAAIRVTAAERGGASARIAVIGMGRLGGAELGYSSDADVLFVCEPVESADADDAVRFASSVAELVRKMLGAPSQDPALQVDADLRPEGRNGPLVRTLESYRAYYEKWGDVWEFQALLRARYVAGDAGLAQRFLSAITGFRYPEGGVGDAQAREVRRIKARVDNERLPRGADPKTHTKLGRGGLADVEWTVQLLQLQHAYRVPALRTTSTVDGLRAAADAGLIGQDDAASLRESWLLATKVRNAATLVRGKPTDQVPTSGRELAAVASVLGYTDEDGPGEFLDAYRRTTRRAHTVVERVFYES